MEMPSFNHISHGRGVPFAAQSSVTVVPSLTTDERGFAINTGGIILAPVSANKQTTFTSLTATSNVTQHNSYCIAMIQNSALTIMSCGCPEFWTQMV
jgi:hypothetical protein